MDKLIDALYGVWYAIIDHKAIALGVFFVFA